jgi:hypothetical protein
MTLCPKSITSDEPTSRVANADYINRMDRRKDVAVMLLDDKNNLGRGEAR